VKEGSGLDGLLITERDADLQTETGSVCRPAHLGPSALGLAARAPLRPSLRYKPPWADSPYSGPLALPPKSPNPHLARPTRPSQQVLKDIGAVSKGGGPSLTWADQGPFVAPSRV